MRDYGPIFVRKGDRGIAATKWIFNAWGDKYDELLADDATGMAVARASGVELCSSPESSSRVGRSTRTDEGPA